MAPEMDRTSVSPDGKLVTFEMARNGVKYVGVSGMDGTNFTQLTEGRAPAFSPDGRRIAFVRKVAAYDQVFVVNAQNGGELTQLTNDDADNRAPRWAPNGRYVVFASNRGWRKQEPHGGTAQTTWNIYAIRIDGTQLTQLSDGPTTSVQPFWAFDGFIYFTSNDAGNFDIWRIKPTGDLAAP
jgi:Tol biopolymer transport system component